MSNKNYNQALKNIDVNNFLPLTKTAEKYLTENIQSLAIQRQFRPSDAEYQYLDTQLRDPIGDENHTVTRGLVHRYPQKVLLKITDTCSAYCRFCFRKDMIGKGEGILSDSDIENAFQYIKENKQINEIIFSGGDPLTLSNRRLEDILVKLSKIQHLKIIRFHTRTPIIKPNRIDDALLNILKNTKKKITIVFHVNHHDELTSNVLSVIQKFSKTSIHLKSQSVLLKNINNNKSDLLTLFNILIENNVQPYYLHHMDKAFGTKHFHVPIKEGLKLMDYLSRKLSVNLMPQYTLDIPGGYGKINLQSNSVRHISKDQFEIIDLKGKTHIYYDEGL